MGQSTGRNGFMPFPRALVWSGTDGSAFCTNNHDSTPHLHAYTYILHRYIETITVMRYIYIYIYIYAGDV